MGLRKHTNSNEKYFTLYKVKLKFRYQFKVNHSPHREVCSLTEVTAPLSLQSTDSGIWSRLKLKYTVLDERNSGDRLSSTTHGNDSLEDAKMSEMKVVNAFDQKKKKVVNAKMMIIVFWGFMFFEESVLILILLWLLMCVV